MIFIATDHRGFELKEKLVTWMRETVDIDAREGLRDVTETHDANDDYPVVSAELGRLVASDTLNMGILLCGSGVGASAAVNKIEGIRGAIGLSAKQVKAGRHDDDMNVLVIAADHTDEESAKEMIKAFIETPFEGGEERYRRRIDQITELEKH